MKIIPFDNMGLSPRLRYIRDMRVACGKIRRAGYNDVANNVKRLVASAIKRERTDRAIVVRRLIRDITDPREV